MSEPEALRALCEELADVFGWADKSPEHAILNVRREVDELRDELAFCAWEAGRAP